jgi:hypothetical protein
MERERDAAGYLVLHGKRVACVTVEPLCPQMRAGLGINQLGIDPDLIARTPYAPFQHIAHTEFVTDLLRIDRLVFVGERGIAGDHEHAGNPRQVSRQIIGDASAKYCCPRPSLKSANGRTTIDKRGALAGRGAVAVAVTGAVVDIGAW